MFQIVAIFRP